MPRLIELEGVSRRFGQGTAATLALDQVSLRIEDGETVAVEGPSGSGKSTLLSLLGLLDEPSAGIYRLRGQPVAGLSARQRRLLRNRHIGWIFQNFNLIGDLDVLGNVILPLRFNPDVPRQDRQPRALEALRRVGLAEKLRALPSQLSGGQQQRVAIARALVNRPSLVLADEPTGNLDTATGNGVMELLLELAAGGATLVLVSHDPALAARCSRRLRLVDGRLVDGV